MKLSKEEEILSNKVIEASQKKAQAIAELNRAENALYELRESCNHAKVKSYAPHGSDHCLICGLWI